MASLALLLPTNCRKCVVGKKCEESVVGRGELLNVS